MGLDITAYSGLKKLDVSFDVDGEPVMDWDHGRHTRFYVNDDFPGRNGSIQHKMVYEHGDSFGFCAGSYGGYNNWREELAALADYPQVEHESVAGYAPSRRLRRDAAAWRGLCAGKPFVELVNFSDCEGVIGPEVAAKLAQDFAAFDEKAAAVGGWFYKSYQDWRKAFEMASRSGAVSFH